MLVSCEHASSRVPAAWARRVTIPPCVLAGHRASDPGSRATARGLARALGVSVHEGRATRLLVDLNRSLSHPRLHSEWSRALPREDRALLVEELWQPFREAFALELARALARGRRVLHVSIHSFTPVLDGRERETDLGLLYDPSRALESDLARRWSRALSAELPGWRVHANRPYRGTSDGHTSALRRMNGPGAYLGIELEWNQARVGAGGARAASLGRLAARCLIAVLEA